MKQNGDVKVKLAYAAVCIFWGSTYLAIRIGVRDFPPALFAGIRFVIAGLLVLFFAKVKRYSFPSSFNEYKQLAIVGLLLLLGGNGLVVFASRWVHSGMSSLMFATVPLFMALLEALALKKRTLSMRGYMGLISGFGGIVLLVYSNYGKGAMDLKGASILLLAAICWSAGSIFSKGFHPTGSTVSHIGIQMLSGGSALSIAGIVMGEMSHIQLSAKGVGAILYLIIFGSVIAYSCYIYVLEKWSASKAGTYAYVNPVVAILLGAVILKESISFSVIISAMIILGSVFIVQASKDDDKRIQMILGEKKA
jgi:drug/metabolite transporter (DMT)-like permease